MSEFDPKAGEAAQLLWGMFARTVAQDDLSDHDAGLIAEEVVELLGSERRALLVTIESVTILFRVLGVTPAHLQDIALFMSEIRDGREPR